VAWYLVKYFHLYHFEYDTQALIHMTFVIIIY